MMRKQREAMSLDDVAARHGMTELQLISRFIAIMFLFRQHRRG